MVEEIRMDKTESRLTDEFAETARKHLGAASLTFAVRPDSRPLEFQYFEPRDASGALIPISDTELKNLAAQYTYLQNDHEA